MEHNEANIHFLLHAAALVGDVVKHELSMLGIGHSQARMLDALDRMGPSSQARLAEELDITAPSMSTLTTRMIAGGQIDRHADPHEKRSNVISLSDKGERLLADIRAAWLRVDQIVEEKLGREQAAGFFTASRSLRDSLGGRSPALNRGQSQRLAET